MNTAIIYSFSSKKTANIAKKIVKALNKDFDISELNAEGVTRDDFLRYDNIIIGTSTWFDGELPGYWDEFIPALEDIDFKGKTVAIFGLGDQEGYPENFADGVGILGRIVKNNGARLIGYTSNTNYAFEASQALENDEFMGLILDEENQAQLTDNRVSQWVAGLKKDL